MVLKVSEKRNTTLLELWNIANTFNTLNPRQRKIDLFLNSFSPFKITNNCNDRQFKLRSEECMMSYQKDVIRMIKEGYDETAVSIWRSVGRLSALFAGQG